jgi:hypothetical protein
MPEQLDDDAKKKRALLALCDAIVDVVQRGGEWGVPGGTIYVALMAHGCSLEQFEGIMRALVTMQKVERRGDVYFGRRS